MQLKNVLPFMFSGVFLNMSCINTNSVEKGSLLNRKKERSDDSDDLMKEWVEYHNSNADNPYKIVPWGGWKPNQMFEKFQYLLNPVAFNHSSGCSYQLYNDYMNNNWTKEAWKLWSIDKVRRQKNSGCDSDIDDYIDNEGVIITKENRMNLKSHELRYADFMTKYDDSPNFLAFMYKYIQTNRHADDENNNKYHSSTVRKRFINAFDEKNQEDFIDDELYTPFGNLKVQVGSSQSCKKNGITLRNVRVYPTTNDSKFYSYHDIGQKFNTLDIGKKIKILELVNDYLCTSKAYDECKKDWEARVDDLSLKGSEKEVFAVLCGIAVLAEPLRECDDGTSQRCVYKTMLHYLKKLESGEIKLETHSDWNELLKNLENNEDCKHSNLLKLYDSIVKKVYEDHLQKKREKIIKKREKRRRISKFFFK